MIEVRNARTGLLVGPLFAFFIVATTGCHSKTEPSPQNFTAALNAFYLERPECLFPEVPHFPYETSDTVKTKQMDSLTKELLLTVQEERALHVRRYTPTPAGDRVAPRFCYGHRVISSIDSFTPPAQANGFPETHVKYHYTMEEVPVWAKADEVRTEFPEMAHKTSGTATDEATLAVTMAGWQVPD